MSVRSRTLQHLRKLARHVGAAGATQIAACYTVVDQLPEPAECATTPDPDWERGFIVDAGWVLDDGVDVIQVSVDTAPWEVEGLGASTAVSVEGGTLVRVEGTGDHMSLLVTPTEDRIVILVPILCTDQREGTLEILLDAERETRPESLRPAWSTRGP